MNQGFERGDFVKCASGASENYGIVIDIHPTNVGTSKHVQNIAGSYQNVYYILTETSSVQGPYFFDELIGVQ